MERGQLMKMLSVGLTARPTPRGLAQEKEDSASCFSLHSLPARRTITVAYSCAQQKEGKSCDLKPSAPAAGT